jgi:hypothetical protein
VVKVNSSTKEQQSICSLPNASVESGGFGSSEDQGDAIAMVG